ncbi:MAG: arginine--tRNA ligase [Oscillibacter sp.]|nr:arginine--tRNA ligase [Oscillibacter sp.]
MIHMIQKAKEQVQTLTDAAYQKTAEEGLLPAGVTAKATIEIPKDVANGDYTTTFCLAAAKAMRKNPREVAKLLTERMDLSDSYFTSVAIAGPGFLNFRLGDKWYKETLSVVETEGADYGKNDMLQGKKYMVEFVSANPTGPMHMGNARGGVLGDTLAQVLSWSGADVWREFYVNDAGNQIEKFAKSLEARYLQIIKGEDAVEFPEDGYHGDDIRELAQLFYEENGDKYLNCEEKERHDTLSSFGLNHNIPKMKTDLARYGIRYDRWFFESSLHESGFVADTVNKLTERGFTYEKDGALWLRTSQILAAQLRAAGKTQEDIDKLDLKDDVLRRANGFYTYFAADIAYHRNKFEVRGFDKVINIWGADHHGHVARLKGAMDALGLNGTEKLDIVLMQLVKLVRDGEVVRMSKRTGKAISLTDLLDEIPVDACRYFFNAKPETQMEFDLGLAVREDSENPVYYVQYAHARICTLLKNLAAEGHAVPKGSEVDLSVLTDDLEKALIKQIAAYCEEVRLAARDYDPSHINRYLIDLAAAFHKFYNACRIKGEEEKILSARLLLADCTRRVLENAMKLIGCSAPEKM